MPDLFEPVEMTVRIDHDRGRGKNVATATDEHGHELIRLTLDDTVPRVCLIAGLVPQMAEHSAARAAGVERDRTTEAEVHVTEVALGAVDIDEAGRVHLPAVLAASFGVSTSEARRVLTQGGVKVAGEPISQLSYDFPAHELAGALLQFGRRRYARVSFPAVERAA